MLNNLVPRKKKKKKMTLAEAREYLADQEVNKLLDTDQINREAVLRAQENGIIFIDEIDKIASNAKGSGPDISREGVQRDLLPIVEGTVVNTKYGMVKTDHVLFIAAGAFHVSKPSDLIPELQGRFPIRVTLNALTQEDLVKILSQPQNALTRQYQALLNSEGASIEFTESAIEEIAKSAFTVNQEIENIGARRLQTIMSRILGDILYEVPDLNESRKFVIDEAFVKEKLKGIAGNTDLSKFIL
jgi:ATP-dependent HslUV protease ATP-binding subunit HslU